MNDSLCYRYFKQESFGSTEDDQARFTYTLALCAATVGLLELFFFLLASLLRLDKVRDVAGGCAFIVIALLSLLLNNHHDLKVGMILVRIVVPLVISCHCSIRSLSLSFGKISMVMSNMFTSMKRCNDNMLIQTFKVVIHTDN